MINKLKRALGFNPLRWLLNTRRMATLLREFPTDATQATAGAVHCGIVITPWQTTWIPWFSLGVGVLLARKGNRVTFLLDDQPFGKTGWRYHFVLGCIRSVMKPLRARHRVLDLSTLQGRAPLDEQARARAVELARLNAVWQLRGEIVPDGREHFTAQCERQMLQAYPAIAQVLQPGAFDLLFVPGGVWGNSGIWVQRARAAGIRVGTYDSGVTGLVLLASNGVACQLQDIPAAFARLKAQGPDSPDIAFAMREAQAEMERRRAGTDTFTYQYQVGGDGDRNPHYDGAVLLALNSSWDSAALGLHAIFEDTTAWIVQTVRHLLEHTDAPVIVRQHPVERLRIARSSDDYPTLLARHFGSHPRLHFIAATDKVNSYELMERVRAMVVYTSTIGTEAAAQGKPVVTASNAYYADLGFVHKARSKDHYLQLLEQAARGELRVSEAQQRDARLCYYLTQCCNWVFTPFNPADFHEWSQRSLESWYADPTVQRLLSSLQDNAPVAYLRHLERMAAARQQAQEARA
jgi:hypothetical protein